MFKNFFEMLKAFKDDSPLGDVAVMKFALFRKPRGRINELLDEYRGHSSNLSRTRLETMPKDSLGRAYADHLQENNIEHLTISPGVVERYKDNPYAIRYTQTHDLHHVIAGFDTSVAGELGVVAFMVGQGVGPISKMTLSLFGWVYPLVSPSQWQACRNNLKVGLRMGEQSKLVMAYPLEDYLGDSIERVRENLGISALEVQRISKGGKSWYVKAIYKLAGRK